MVVFDKVTSRIAGFKTEGGIYLMENGSSDMVFIRDVDMEKVKEFLNSFG